MRSSVVASRSSSQLERIARLQPFSRSCESAGPTSSKIGSSCQWSTSAVSAAGGQLDALALGGAAERLGQHRLCRRARGPAPPRRPRGRGRRAGGARRPRRRRAASARCACRRASRRACRSSRTSPSRSCAKFYRVFDGFGQEAFAWFEALERDNSREYFSARATCTSARCAGRWRDADALSVEFDGDIKVFRQHRDLRFSRDKRPLQGPHLRARAGGCYVQLSSRGLYAGTGYYRADARASSSATGRRSGRLPGPGSRRRSRARGSTWRARALRPRRAATRATTRGSSCCGASS